MPLKISMLYFMGLEKKTQKIIWNHKRLQIPRAITEVKTALSLLKYQLLNYTVEQQ